MKQEIELLEPKFLQLWKELGIKHVIGGEDVFLHMVNSYSNLAFCKTVTKEEYNDFVYCAMILDWYQLIGKKAEKEFPLDWKLRAKDGCYGTDFNASIDNNGLVFRRHSPCCVLGGVWFSREEDRLAALDACSITREFQEACGKYSLGGA